MKADLPTEARAILAEVESNGIVARALGGVGVALRCPSARRPPLRRDYHDLDLATDRRNAYRLAEFLASAGYSPADRFNALHGHTRLMFTGGTGVHVDVIVGEFIMCHKLDLRDRLTLAGETLPLADLLLTKLQIAKINHKDVIDTLALLIDHPLTNDESGINVPYCVKLLSDDWGWWRTVTENLATVRDLLSTLALSPHAIDTASRSLTQLAEEIRRGKRSFRWRARARLGERMPWRAEPEKVMT